MILEAGFGLKHNMIENVNKLNQKRMSPVDKIADLITRFAGSPGFVILHTVWFTLWFVFKLNINLLTLIVSLEAIYLTTFVMMNQNQQDKKNHIELEHDYKINKEADKKIKELHKKIDKIDAKLKI